MGVKKDSKTLVIWYLFADARNDDVIEVKDVVVY